ncbi:hypothetical protein B6I21_04740 [candidate division KSB1 bacterium 4572_119]|nr:MAG: hypothetical protein B6I21_04740 [candidate division KSB1 bacterium 4572_119]
MDNQLILIADGDTKNLGILKENLEASGFMVIISSNGRDAWEKIQRTPPKLILTETSLPASRNNAKFSRESARLSWAPKIILSNPFM